MGHYVGKTKPISSSIFVHLSVCLFVFLGRSVDSPPPLLMWRVPDSFHSLCQLDGMQPQGSSKSTWWQQRSVAPLPPWDGCIRSHPYWFVFREELHRHNFRHHRHLNATFLQCGLDFSPKTPWPAERGLRHLWQIVSPHPFISINSFCKVYRKNAGATEVTEFDKRA